MRVKVDNSVSPATSRWRERGMAVIVVMIIISILLIYIGANLRTLHLMRRDLKLIEQKQLSRFTTVQVITNSAPAAATNSLPLRMPERQTP